MPTLHPGVKVDSWDLTALPESSVLRKSLCLLRLPPCCPPDQGSPRLQVGVGAESCQDLLRCLPCGREFRRAGSARAAV